MKIVMVVIMVFEYQTLPHKNYISTSTTVSCRNIHKYMWTSPDEKAYNQTDHVWIGYEIKVYVMYGSLKAVDCVTDHHLLVAENRVRLSLRQ
jgi:hypothetical protein